MKLRITIEFPDTDIKLGELADTEGISLQVAALATARHVYNGVMFQSPESEMNLQQAIEQGVAWLPEHGTQVPAKG